MTLVRCLAYDLEPADLTLDEAPSDRLEQFSPPIPRSTYPYRDFGVAQRERFLDKGGQVVFEVAKDGLDTPLDGKVT
ncbi:hypothetical protein GCM10011415_02470 [Salipiger pallidus]|uniref:Uncharacterized protein n=1 Tax=Salipiger pallidus TaxID=1775170 RepID=A0A8J2ZG60_9RHOB|nr:hypothetical protein [Salipiger pallidus]GGG60032.1 hypothetical protein GCM10011415_02470 [Salipiger pallidus]